MMLLRLAHANNTHRSSDTYQRVVKSSTVPVAARLSPDITKGFLEQRPHHVVPCADVDERLFEGRQ